ncbi:MAG TPA: hypothetical protein VGE79_16535 [Niastella sp.]
MKQYFSFAAALAAVSILLICSCGRKSSPLDEPIDTNTQTPVGSPAGNAVKKTIDAQGGELTSADGRIQVIIPAGALSAAKELSIQPIGNELPGGIGQAFRILPHGEQFSKPVTIVFNYKAEDTLNTLPQFLDVAFQDEKGNWQALNNTIVDRAKRTLTVTTTHFSDWGYFKSMTLTPAEKIVNTEEEVALKVTTRFPYVDPDDQPKGEATTPVYTAPRELRPDEIKGWTYQGEGILVSRGAQAFYTAPKKVPAANPEAIVANIQMHRKGQFMLISNITVVSNKNVAYLQVDEDDMKSTNGGKCRLYMYGSFGADPGADKRSVTINNTAFEVDLWAPTIIRCKIDETISGAIDIQANGKTIAQSTLRKFTGKFLYERFQGGVLNSTTKEPLKETTLFELVYRGFGQPCPSNVTPILSEENTLATGTAARFTLSGSATIVTLPKPGTCATTTSVSLPTSSGMQPMNSPTTPSVNGFKVKKWESADGITIRIWLNIKEVITGVRVKRTSCNGSSLDPARTLGVGLEGFGNVNIPLVFSGSSGLILKNPNGLTSNKLSSSILIDAWDGTGEAPTHYDTDGGVPATFKNAP